MYIHAQSENIVAVALYPYRYRFFRRNGNLWEIWQSLRFRETPVSILKINCILVITFPRPTDYLIPQSPLTSIPNWPLLEMIANERFETRNRFLWCKKAHTFTARGRARGVRAPRLAALAARPAAMGKKADEDAGEGRLLDGYFFAFLQLEG